MVSPSNVRLAQLKAFDETKAGVKGLVDAGISTIPSIFLNPDVPEPCKTSTTNVTIPTIDLSGIKDNPKRRGNAVKMVKDALETWGFFQVVNHGIPETMLGEMLTSTQSFFDLDYEVRTGYYCRDYMSTKFLHNSNFDLHSGMSTNWMDSFSCITAPSPPKLEELPPCLRFKSVRHRVLANTRGPRMSVASFFTNAAEPTPRFYGPIKEILSESNPPVYREATSHAILIVSKDNGLTGTSALENFRL